MKRFVIGDIHGAYKALIQCFELSGFDRENDLLISLGDLADGWPDVDKVFNELLTVQNLVTILGNHDQWLLHWFRTGDAPDIWLKQGGSSTIKSIGDYPPERFRELLEKSVLYHKRDNFLFVHGGILIDRPLEMQDKDVFLWDRSLIRQILKNLENGVASKLTSFDMVFVGHTPTINFGPPEPIISNGVCMLDSGAGWPGGKLTIMNIDTGEYHNSDIVDLLYPNFKVR
jgi:serine/threonine protein phosphatase 1